MKVTLITHTSEPEKIIAGAAKLCYSSSDIESLMNGLTSEKIESFIKKLNDIGHQSPLEHCTFTFGVEGVSRTLLAQLTRHRIASYSVKSQRYVKEGQFEYVIPKSIEEDDMLFLKYIGLMKEIQTFYNSAIKRGVQPEDARYALPNACSTQLIMTFNIRSLLNFFELRCCNRAQWEIRQMANMMLDICKKLAPNLFANAGASCVRGKCKEGAMSCGKPIKKYSANNVLEYKGYYAETQYDEKDSIFIGKVINTRDSLNFHGKSMGELEEMFHQNIDNYLEFRKQKEEGN